MPKVRDVQSVRDIRQQPTRAPTPGRITSDQSIGRGLQQLGGTLQKVAEQTERRQRELEKARARNEVDERVRQTQNDVLEQFDADEAPENFQLIANQRVDEVLGEIEDEQVREEVALEARRNVAISRAQLRRRAIKSQRDQTVDIIQQRIENKISDAALSESGRVRQLRLQEIDSQIDELVQGPFDVDEEQGRLMKQEARATLEEQEINLAVANGDPAGAERMLESAENLPADRVAVLRSRIESAKKSIASGLRREARQAVSFTQETGLLSQDFNRIRDQLPDDSPLAEDMDSTARAAHTISNIKTQPVDDMIRRARRMQQDAIQARDPDRLNEAKMVAGFVDNLTKGLRDDPMRTAVRIGLIPDQETINPTQLDQLGNRIEFARQIEATYGVPASPFFQEEAQALSSFIREQPPSQSAGLMQQISQMVDDTQMEPIIRQLADDEEIVATAFNFIEEPRLSRKILQGRQAQNELNITFPRARTNNAFNGVAGDMFANQPRLEGMYREAAKALFAARAQETGDVEFDEARFRDAVRDVIGARFTSEDVEGGGTIRHNGSTLPPVRGMSNSQFSRGISRMQQRDIQRFGNGRPVFGDTQQELTPQDLADARFIPRGRGEYLVTFPDTGDGFVFTAPDENGESQPYVINLRDYFQNNTPDPRPSENLPAFSPL